MYLHVHTHTCMDYMQNAATQASTSLQGPVVAVGTGTKEDPVPYYRWNPKLLRDHIQKQLREVCLESEAFVESLWVRMDDFF